MNGKTIGMLAIVFKKYFSCYIIKVYLKFLNVINIFLNILKIFFVSNILILIILYIYTIIFQK